MCVENEFDPVLIEVALHQRRKEVEMKEAEQERKKAAKQSDKKQLNAALVDKLKNSATSEAQKALLQSKTGAFETPNKEADEKKENKIVSKLMKMNKMHSNKISNLKTGSKEMELEIGPISSPQGDDGANGTESISSSENTARNDGKATGQGLGIPSTNHKQELQNKSIQNEMLKKNDNIVTE